MSDFFFSGSYVAKLDEKNRFVLPQEMRYGLVEDGRCEFVIGLGLGGCLAIYRKSLIEKIVRMFRKNQHVAKFQKFFTLFFSTLFPTDHDKVGRVTLPSNLRNAVGIDKELVIAGVMDKIEIWPKHVYDKNLQALLDTTSSENGLGKMIEEAFSLLQDPLIKTGDMKSPEEAISSAMNPCYIPECSPECMKDELFERV